MKSFLITLSLFALCATSSTFLRNLESKGTIASFTFACNKGLTLPNTFTATTTADGRPTAQATAVTTLHLDGVAQGTTTNDLKYNCEFPAPTPAPGGRLRNLEAYEATCTKDATPGTATYGTYKVVSMAVGADTITFSSASGNSWEFAEEFALADSQTTSQEVDAKSDDKKTFTVALKAAMTGVAPKIYTNATETAKEVPCALDTEKKKIICTPTATQMDSGKEYTVQYKKACGTDFTSTGITVKFSASYFITVSKILLVLALLF